MVHLGTGKTRCASLLIATALKIKIKRDGEEEGKESTSKLAPPRILAVTHSNGAADVLLEALLQMGVPAVRLGSLHYLLSKVFQKFAF